MILTIEQAKLEKIIIESLERYRTDFAYDEDDPPAYGVDEDQFPDVAKLIISTLNKAEE